MLTEKKSSWKLNTFIIKKKKKTHTFRKPKIEGNFLIIVKVIPQRPTVNIMFNEDIFGQFHVWDLTRMLSN